MDCAAYFLIGGAALWAAASAAPAQRAARGARFEAGVVLTFDDTFVQQWEAAAPIFKKHQAHATFFVTTFDRLRPEQIAGLERLRAAGHAVACHGLRHRKAADYAAAHGVDAYLRDEVGPAVRLMREAGLAPTAFAYPCSQHNAKTDAALLTVFRHLRTGAGVSKGKTLRELDCIFTPVERVATRGCLVGTGIDYTGTPRRPPDFLQQIKAALDRAKERREVVVFYAHNISNTGPGHHLAPSALEQILAHVQRIGLKSYTYDDLP